MSEAELLLCYRAMEIYQDRAYEQADEGEILSPIATI